jgi:sugar lactone lactonase YvrE
VLALLLATAALAQPAPRTELRLAYARARAAYDRKDYAAFLEESRRVATLAPGSTRALHDLARALALSGDARGAVASLERLVALGVDTGPDADGDLAGLRERADFQAVVQRMAGLHERIGSSSLAVALAEKDLLTEGIAHDPASGDWFVSSVHRRKVVRVGADGRVQDFVASGTDGLLAAMGVGVDGGRRALWVSSQALPQMGGYRAEDAGRSFVFEYDLESARLRRRLGPPEAAPDARFGDLSVAPDGEVLVSDAFAGRLYVLRAHREGFEVLVDAGPLASPQGLAISDDGRQLHVADYTQGIARVDRRDGGVRFLESAAAAALTGIDGLVRHGDSLVAIQNGIRPHRILRLRLDPAGERIEDVVILERGNPLWEEPTLGVRVGQALHYVATSQWERFGEDGSVDDARLRPPLVLKLRLGW